MTGNFSIVSLPVNLLILVFIPATMFFGFCAGVIGMFSSILALPFAYISYLLLSYELKIVEIFSNLSFSSYSFPSLSMWLVFLIYALMIYLIRRAYARAEKNKPLTILDIKTTMANKSA